MLQLTYWTDLLFFGVHNLLKSRLLHKTPTNWNQHVCRQIKQLLAAYRRGLKVDESSEVEDKIAECSGDEQGETVSSNGDPVDMTAGCSGDEQVETTRRNGDEMDTPRKPKQDVVTRNGLWYGDSDESDDELRELVEKKKRLERLKETLSDAKQRRRTEREILKSKLKTDVETLETEVADLNLKYKVRDLRR